MLFPKKVVDIELNRPLESIEHLAGYYGVLGLVRLNGAPLGYIDLPVINGRCPAAVIKEKIAEQHSHAILRQGLYQGLAAGLTPDEINLENIPGTPVPRFAGPYPLVTVAVCTRDRTEELALCLNALAQLDYPNLEILVVDNAPTTTATEQLVATHYPAMRYVCEPRPGLDWARNRAILEARGEIIAYTDDDVIVDSGWVMALVQPFVEDTAVMAVTGLVVPYELETEAQNLFEHYGGFSRGFERRWIKIDITTRPRWHLFGTGQYGTGANMAYRRSVFGDIGLFDPALDVGTVTNGGGDLEMFFRIIKEGHILVYEPGAIVRHRHRREYARLQTQLANNSIGLYSFFVRSAQRYPDEWIQFLRLGLWWFLWWYIRRLILSLLFPQTLPQELLWSETKGVFTGLGRYQQARHHMAQVINKFGPHPEFPKTQKPQPAFTPAPEPYATAVRTIALNQPITAINGLKGYTSAKMLITMFDGPIGYVDIGQFDDSISRNRLLRAIANQLEPELLKVSQTDRADKLPHPAVNLFIRQTPDAEKITGNPEKLPDDVSVSVVLATLDRPDDLRNCLHHLHTLQTSRPVEIVVVDNNPASGQTPPVVAEFPNVVLVNESRKGLAYARNAGFVASTGKIVIATDDDVTVPPDWLENLVAPFSRPDVMAVTGNVLPIELESLAQHRFERYGGLGRGFKSFEADYKWFEANSVYAARTWELGATANAAFRAAIFTHPQIGLMDEALGPGMPSGVGEDTYLFYKILRAGYLLVYQPSAYVWHKHRRTDAALRKQLFNYSKGHVAYHLTTLLRDRDFRAIIHLSVWLPLWRVKQLVLYIKDVVTGNLFRGKGRYPLNLILIEIYGNLLGPLALWQSRRRVRREGKSSNYELKVYDETPLQQVLPHMSRQPNV